MIITEMIPRDNSALITGFVPLLIVFGFLTKFHACHSDGNLADVVSFPLDEELPVKFLSEMMDYTISDMMIIITDDAFQISNAKAYYKQVTKLKYYFNILVLDASNYRKIENMDFTQALTILYCKVDTTVEIINWAMNKTRLLDKVSWVVHGFTRCHRHDNLVEISPRMRLFNVHRELLGRRSTFDKRVVSLTYIYQDFINGRCSMSETIGHCTSSSSLTVKKDFGLCCFNTTGYPVRTVYVENPSDFEIVSTKDNSTTFTGFTYEIYSDIFKYLGLRDTLYKCPDGKYGDYDIETNESYGLFGELHKKKADVAVSFLGATEGRKHAAEFSIEIIRTGFTVGYPKPTEDDDLYFYLKPFTWNVWILTALTCITVLLLEKCFMKISRSAETWNFLNVWGAFMNQGVNVYEGNCWMKLFYLLVLFNGVLLSVYYSSKILAMKAVRMESFPFTSMIELAEQDAYVPITGAGWSIIQDIMNSDYYEFVAMRKKIQQDYKKHVMELNASTIEQKLKKENVALISSLEYLNYFKNRNKNLQIMENMYLLGGIHIAWQKEFSLGRIINTMLMKMKENGQIKKLYDKYWRTTDKIPKTTPPDEIQLRTVMIPLAVVGCGIVMSFLLALIEKQLALKVQTIHPQ